MVRTIPFIAAAVLVSALYVLAQGTACNLLTAGSQIPQGFAAPYNVLSAGQELLVSVSCPSTSSGQAMLSVGNGQQNQYVYNKGYTWRNNQWQEITLSGGTPVSGVWLVGRGSARMPQTASELSQQNFVVAYVCQWTGAEWKCGCRDDACADNMWQLQVFRSSESDDGGATEGTVVRYTSSGFTPDDITISVGQTVTFVNESSRDMWVASDVHPTHEVYDGTALSEHCSGGTRATFDQCSSGSSYSFAFEKTGAWGYHNHVHPSHTGTIRVRNTDTSGQSNTVLHTMEGNTEVLVEDLDTPWDMAFLPDGTMLITQRYGGVTHVARDGSKTVTEIDVDENGESGLYGIALHPNFASNNWVYIFYHNNGSGHIERRTFSDRRLTNPTPIVDNLPGGSRHGGGALRFGPDGMLYAGVGELAQRAKAQDTSLLHGKILRFNDDGSIPASNPFGNAVYSYGHRNVQGITWDAEGRMWASEHGPSGDDGPQGYDELNLIERGGNYGWPEVCCNRANKSGMIEPKAISGSGGQTWAPNGAVYWNGSVFMGGLRGSSVLEAKISGGTNVSDVEWHFRRDYGRIRPVNIGPDGMLYFGTSNGDQVGRQGGKPDKIIRVNPEIHFR